MSWYAKSYGWIKKQQMDNPDMSTQELKRFCAKHYPFIERRGYAYKSFLKAQRDIFGAARRARPTSQQDMLESLKLDYLEAVHEAD
jgi:hypothetical protein